MRDERRTDQGALLRSGIDFVKQLEVPEGKRGIAAVVADEQGAVVGVAFVTHEGKLEWKGGVQTAFRQGRNLRIIGSVEWD